MEPHSKNAVKWGCSTLRSVPDTSGTTLWRRKVSLSGPTLMSSIADGDYALNISFIFYCPPILRLAAKPTIDTHKIEPN